MTRIITSLDEIAAGYRVLYCDLWGCLHDGIRVFPAAIAALERFRAGGGIVVLLTNSPRPSHGVAAQLLTLQAPPDSHDLVVSSGDAAQAAMLRGEFGRRVHHIGPERDHVFFADDAGRPHDIARVPLGEAEGIVCTGLFDDRTETPETYGDTLRAARARGLVMLCANPDIHVDVGPMRIYCAGAIAAAYAGIGGDVHYAGKPHPPIYARARARVAALTGTMPERGEILCVGDGLATDIAGAAAEGLDALLVSGGLAAEETGTTPEGGPDPDRLARVLGAAGQAPRHAIAYLR